MTAASFDFLLLYEQKHIFRSSCATKMDELENSPLSILLVLDDSLFPQLLEWASAERWSTLLIFILETDFFRFRSDEMHSQLPNVGQSFLSSRVEEFQLSISNPEGPFSKFLNAKQTEALVRVAASQIPLHCVLSQVCDIVWKNILSRAQGITKSSSWPSVRRFMMKGLNINLDLVMNEPSSRIYFERFLQSEQANLSCLHCYAGVNRLLKSVALFNRPCGEAVHTDPCHDKRIRAPHSSLASIADARHVLQSTSGSMATGSSGAAISGGTGSRAGTTWGDPGGDNSKVTGDILNWQDSKNKDVAYAYVDTLEAFKVLLEGTRSLQKQFFPVSNASSAGSNIGHSNSRRGSGGIVSVSEAVLVCGGLSEALRMEIAAALALNSSVRTSEIDSVDEAFAEACSNSLQSLLVSLELELRRHLLVKFQQFENSEEYGLMIAMSKAEKCGPVQKYLTKLEFLYDRVRRHKFISWVQEEAKGRMYLVYGVNLRERLDTTGRFLSYDEYDDNSSSSSQDSSIKVECAASSVNKLSESPSLSSDTGGGIAQHLESKHNHDSSKEQCRQHSDCKDAASVAKNKGQRIIAMNAEFGKLAG